MEIISINTGKSATNEFMKSQNFLKLEESDVSKSNAAVSYSSHMSNQHQNSNNITTRKCYNKMLQKKPQTFNLIFSESYNDNIYNW